MDGKVWYYLFINGKPINCFETEEEAEQEVKDYCEWYELDQNEIEYYIDKITDFDEDHPDPYDEYDY